MIAIAAGVLLIGYVLLYAGIKGGDVARHPWQGLSA